MLGDECGHLCDAIIRLQECAQAYGPIQDLVQLLDVGHALGGGELEELLVQPVNRHRHLAWRQDVLDRQCGFVGDRFLDRIFVEVAGVVLGAENLERARSLFSVGNRRAGEADDRGVRHRRHEIGAEILCD